MSGAQENAPLPAPRRHAEPFAFGLAFVLLYAGLAVTFFTQAPAMYQRLDQVFDADLNVWAMSLTRPATRLPHYMVHPLITLFLLPWGVALKGLLKWLGVRFAGRLAIALLCAVAGGAAVGVFRALLQRLGVGPGRARAFTLVFGFSATQLVFSSLPETHAFSALGLVLVFMVAAPPARPALARIAAGVFSFGVTATGIVAVGLTHLDWRRDRRRAPLVALRAVAAVVAVAAVLALVQQAVFPGARPFFIPGPLGSGYTDSVVAPSSAPEVVSRATEVGAHLLFVPLAAPRVDEARARERDVVFEGSPLPSPRSVGVPHAVLWGALVAVALRGLARGLGATPAIVLALVGWLAFVAVQFFFFGASLFLFSGQWLFAVVALVAVGLERVGTGRLGRAVSAAVVVSVGLQVMANAALVADVLRVFSRN